MRIFIHCIASTFLVMAGAAVVSASQVTIVNDKNPGARIYLLDVDAEAAAAPVTQPAPVTGGKVSGGKKASGGRGRDGAGVPLTIAVADLVYHIEKMSGATLETVTVKDAGQVTGPAIVIGDLAVRMGAVPQKKSESQEGFRLLVRGDRILIGGQSDRGAAMGVYELLRILGCDWVMPGAIGEIIPSRAKVSVAEMDISQAPDFTMRRLWYRGYHTKEHPAKAGERERFGQWSRRQKGGDFPNVVGGCGGHVWDAFIGRHRAEFEKDPTMLALRKDRDGQLNRMGPQLESTHPRVIELFVSDIEAAYEKNIASGAWTKDAAVGFGIGPADGLGYSCSPESIAASAGKIDPITGAPDETDLLVLLGNRILDQVHKKYPNAHVGFYSYSTHADYPSRYTPDPKMGVIFAPINFSRFHSVIDPNSRTQAWYREVLEKWGELSRKQGNPLLYRGYSWNLAENLLPYTKVRIWGEELPYYKANRIVGMNVEGTKMWSVLAASDYVFMRLCWDSSLKWKEVLHEYCEHAYGAGGATMERYHLMLSQRQSDAKQEAGSFHAFHLMYDDAWVAEAQKTIDEAKAAAKTDADRTRIGYAAGPLQALRNYLAYHKATRAFDFPAAKVSLDAMRADWARQYEENSDLVSNEGMAYINRFLRQFSEQAVTYSSDPNRIVHRLPDELPTMMDRDMSGERSGYFKPEFDDKAWKTTKTYSSTWDAQRLTDGNRSGSVWYRVRFDLPADLKGKPIGLFLGGFEDEARVWINGKPIGSSGVQFSNPATFDLTDAATAAPGGANVLAIQVIRNSAANEIGLGGLLRPSFVFTGPQLDRKARQPADDREVLPGGELRPRK